MSANGGETRTFRGKSLAELLPRIRHELGADAVITRQREGLHGGIAGFFQKPFVELEAHGGARSIDVYDEGLESPAIRALISQASPFADQLEAEMSAEPEPEPSEQPAVRRFGRARPPQADAVERTLVD